MKKGAEKVEGKPWGIDGAMIELMKQVGQLIRSSYDARAMLSC